MSFSRLMLTTAAFGALALPALATTHATRHHAPAKVHRVATPSATSTAPAAAATTMAPGTMAPGTSAPMAPSVDAKRAMPDAKAGAAVTTPAPKAPAVAATPAAPGTVRAN